MENMNKCPGCSQHCDRNNLQCGKGEAYFNGESIPDSGHPHVHHERKHQGHHEGKHHGHRHHRPEFPAGSLADLLVRCSHRLLHGGHGTMFSVLSEAEQNALETLLSKLLSN